MAFSLFLFSTTEGDTLARGVSELQVELEKQDNQLVVVVSAIWALRSREATLLTHIDAADECIPGLLSKVDHSQELVTSINETVSTSQKALHVQSIPRSALCGL